MSLAPLLLLAATASPASPSAYPASDVLAAFGEACATLDQLARAESTIEASGWTATTPPAGSPLAELVAFGMTEGRKLLAEGKGTMSEPRIYRREVAGEELHIVLSGIVSDGYRVNGCRMYDVGETRPLPIAAAEAWIGRPPGEKNVLPEVTIARWSPGYRAGQNSFDLFFVPPGSPAIALLKVSGVALKADFVGDAD